MSLPVVQRIQGMENPVVDQDAFKVAHKMHYTNYVQAGYLAGFRGEDPDSRLEKFDEYATAWLHGREDREAGVPDRLQDPPANMVRKCQVRIPKGTVIKNLHTGTSTAGRTYTVTLHDVYQVNPAHFEHGFRGEFNRPRPAQVMWAGTGGYWSYADAVDVTVVETES